MSKKDSRDKDTAEQTWQPPLEGPNAPMRVAPEIRKQLRNDLFDNPMVREARKNMSEEDIERLARKGDEIFATDIVSINEDTNNSSEEVLEQLKCMMRSGIHPSYLSREEKEFLNNYVGDSWFEEFGYLKNDLNRINFGKDDDLKK